VIMKAVKKHTALDITIDPDAESRQQRGEERARTWPWGSLVALAASVLLLGGSLWCYLEREELQSWMR
jgi:hypothetical protein